MASFPILTVFEESRVSPPPAIIGDRSLSLTFFDLIHLMRPPIHHLLFYKLPLTRTQFLETIIPNLKHSLSVTLQHFFPFAGNLFVFPTSTIIPEIRYVEGDSVKVTFVECNLDFNHLTGYHPRNCDKFYHLIPRLGNYVKSPDYVKIPIFSIQVTFFHNHGISIGMTSHHSLGDASTQYSFLKAWTSIAQCGTDESFLANGTLPLYERVVKYPELNERFLKHKTLETLFSDEFQPPHLSGPTDKVRASFILARTVIDQLKKTVTTQLPTLPYVSSFTIACAYIWCCIAKSGNNESQLFGVPLDCRARLDPPIPAAYFGNCVLACGTIANTDVLTGKHGLINGARLIGECLHNMLTDKDGMVKHRIRMEDSFSNGMPLPKTMISVSGTPKLKLYDLDFGWGRPEKIEKISIDYSGSISMDGFKELNGDLEVGVCLAPTQMEAFVRIFDQGLQLYV